MEDDLSPHELAAAETGLTSLLERHPEAWVAGVQADFTLAPPPVSIPLAREQVVESGTVEDLFHADDLPGVYDAWEHVRAGEEARSATRRLDGKAGVVHLIDARRGTGVILLLWLPTGDTLLRTVWRQNEIGLILEADEFTTTLLGWSPQELVGRRSLQLIHPDDQPKAVESFTRARDSVGPTPPIRLRHLCQDGSWRWLESTSENLLDDPQHGPIRSVRVDVHAQMAEPSAHVQQSAPALPRFMRWRQDELGVVREIDEATSMLLGYSAEELVGRRSLEIIHPDDHQRAIENWMEMLVMPGLARQNRSRHRRKDGTWLWVETTNHNLLQDPAHGYVQAEKVDISKEMAAYEALRAREQLLHRLAESLPQGVAQIDASQHVVYTNARMADVVGVQNATTLSDLMAHLVVDDRLRFDSDLTTVLTEGNDRDLELRLRSPNSSLRLVQVSMRPLTDDAGGVTGAIISVLDVTESVNLREELRDRATYDDLTRCYNRATIMMELERMLRGLDPEASVESIAVLFVDLDQFKSVNDELGHDAGDDLLVAACQRLRAGLRDRDALGRLGGDEFLVICPGVRNAFEALEVAERLASSLRVPLEIAAGVVSTQASVGVSWQPADRATGDSLVQQADIAMYASKRKRRGQAVLFSPALVGDREQPREQGPADPNHFVSASM